MVSYCPRGGNPPWDISLKPKYLSDYLMDFNKNLFKMKLRSCTIQIWRKPMFWLGNFDVRVRNVTRGNCSQHEKPSHISHPMITIGSGAFSDAQTTSLDGFPMKKTRCVSFFVFSKISVDFLTIWVISKVQSDWFLWIGSKINHFGPWKSPKSWKIHWNLEKYK